MAFKMKHKWQSGMYSGMAADKLKFIQKTGDGKSMAKQTDDAKKITEEASNKQDALNAAKEKSSNTSFKNKKGQTITQYTTGAGNKIYRVKGTQGEVNDAEESDFNDAKKYQDFKANVKSTAIENAAANKTAAEEKAARIKASEEKAAARRAEVAEEKAMGVKPGQKTDFEVVAKGKN